MKILLSFATLVALTGPVLAAPYEVAEKDIATLQADMAAGRISAAELVRAYLARIDALDRNGPQLHAVIAVNPNAVVDAAALDAERKAKGARGPLHGIPILVKDNIETADPMPTTAGSLALANNVTHRDAALVVRLRAAGAVILGKTNLSEWANFRSNYSIWGWSGVGGLVKNPYVLDRNACGSSSGSGAAVAASLAAAAIGTETNGSLVCPGSFNGIVSFKPTVGLVSRTHVVPISHTQDTAGPMARTVADAAAVLNAMSGSDPVDMATASADSRKADFAALSGASLKGKRLGVITAAPGAFPAETALLLARALDVLKAQGADIVEINDFTPPPEISADEKLVLQYEFKAGLNAYLASLPAGMVRSLSDLIAFNAASPRETVLFGQNILTESQARGDLGDPDYVHARDELKSLTTGALDDLFRRLRLDAVIRPTNGPAVLTDRVRSAGYGSPDSASLPAEAGYPHLTVPMGYDHGLPVGLSFIGPAWSDASILALGHGFEQATRLRKPPAFLPSLETDAGSAFAPAHE
ncbi:MAG: amidase [Alphaproteobacteria bacterium]|nr:amidase [Alphaproteobacteria bacterium]